MKEDYLLITSIIYAIYAFYFDNGMKLNDGYTRKLDHLLQKSIRYKHHYENYKESLELDLIPASLKIKKLPAITAITPNFCSKWNEVLHKTEKELVNLLLIESSKVVEETERDVEEEIRTQYPTDYDRKRLKVEEQYHGYRKKLGQRRIHKWNKIKLKEEIPQRPTESASDQNDEPRNIKEDMRMENKVTQAANVRVKCKLRIDSCNITDNRKFRKRKTYSEVVKEKEMKRQDEKVFDLETIKENLLQDKVLQPRVLSPPLVCYDTSVSKNSSDQFFNINSPSVLTAQDEELVKILEDLDCSRITRENANSSDESRLSGYFCSDTVFNLSKRVLSETEIRILEKGLDYAPMQRKINEPELKSDFEEFCRRMRIKWHFRNEPSENFSEIPPFRPRSYWKPPKGNPNHVPKDAFLVTADVVGLYPNILHEAGLKSLKEALDRRREKKYLQRILLKWQNLC